MLNLRLGEIDKYLRYRYKYTYLELAYELRIVTGGVDTN